MDDDESVLSALLRLLQIIGFRVQAFDSGSAFLRVLPSLEFACVVLDLHMPGVAGWEICERMSISHPAIPVIFMTGDVDSAVLDKVHSVTPVVLLRKPFSQRQLLDALSIAVGTAV